MHVLQLVNLLRATNSRLEKEAILDNLAHLIDDDYPGARIVERTQQFFYMVYNPLINFWYAGPFTTNKPSGKFSLFDDNITADLGTIMHRVVTGNAGKAFLQDVYDSLDEWDRELFNMVLARDAKCGVTATTINKIWPGLIPAFDVMLCQEYNDKNKKHIKWPAYVQLKYDASRVCVFVDEFGVVYRTRNGKTYYIDNPDLDAEFSDLRYRILEISKKPETTQLVFDGELYQLTDDGKIENRQISNGVATKLVRNKASKQEMYHIGITLWDVVEGEAFSQGTDLTKYEDRFSLLSEGIKKTITSNVFLAETKIVDSEQEALAWSNELMAQGEEGVIIKNADGIWQNKRSKDCLKVKAVLEADLLITSFDLGKGKYADKIGALNCESNDGKIKVAVGSGLTDEQRASFLSEDIIGKIVVVKYNGVIPNAEGNGSTLFLPRFVEIREDKTEADIL